MNSNYNSQPSLIKFLIQNSMEPLIFKNMLNCDLLSWNLEKWNYILRNEKLEFRCGLNNYTYEPQWEYTTEKKYMNFQDFMEYIGMEQQNWMYFDYKYLKDWLLNVTELRNNISWDAFGFPDMSIRDTTIWIGSKGAHTPCHKDTYGCNIIFQVYGKKQWIIFPPEENLRPSRVPYEESSIYSKLNFFSPTIEEFKGVGNCRKIVLTPGDVLFLPNKWWHYVENLEAAISFNIWLPIEIDNVERINESLVQLLMKQLTKDLNEETQNIILNPNIKEEMNQLSFVSSLEIVDICTTKYKEYQKPKKLRTEDEHKTSEHAETPQYTIEDILKQYTSIKKLKSMTDEDFRLFLIEQSSRFKLNEIKNKPSNEFMNKTINVINAVTHPDVVALIKEKLLK